MYIFLINKKNIYMNKKIIISLTCLLFSCNLILFFAYLFTPNDNLNKPNYIELQDINNEKIYSYNHAYQGDYVYLKDVSNCFIKTLINTEDKNFYSHHGFDYKRIIASLFNNLKTSSLSSGASTISQQLARNLYLNNEKTLLRKIKEAFLSVKLESRYSKDYILELYINSVYFAHNIYGLKTASNYYFHKDPITLNYQESCLLVGIINAPNLYSPFIDENASNQKQKNIAYSLYLNNIIDINEYYNILQNKSPLYGSLKINNQIEQYYHQGINKELQELKINKDSKQGLIIQTYLNQNLENLIQRTISNYKINDQLAIIIMKPYSGEVLALTGGKNYFESEYNRALDSYRQIGSTIKPFIYYLGLINGLTPLSKFNSSPTEFKLEDGTNYSPRNSNNIYAYKDITMIEALGMSDNIYAVKTALLVGSNNIKKFLNYFYPSNQKSTISISLGGIELTPLQLISIYNTFASEGIYYKPKFIKNVSYTNGIQLYEAKKGGKIILKHDECMMINYLMQAPFDRGLITYSSPTMVNYQTINQYACKTGTTSSSSWVVGFNKKYTLLVYVGDDENKKLSDGTIAKKIWKDIANELIINEENNFYDIPNSLKLIKFHNSIYNIYSKNYLIKK